MLSITWSHVEDLRRFDNALKTLGTEKMAKVANRAINRAGDQARTQVRRALVKQTGLPNAVIKRALKTRRSSWAGIKLNPASTSTLSYALTTQGGDVSLKYFAAKETRRGVSAKPFGEREVFDGAFIKGGRFPKANRVTLGMGGHVFQRTGSGRLPIEKVKSGVVIPAEMVKGATADAFTSTVARVLPERLAHEISRATKGVIS